MSTNFMKCIHVELTSEPTKKLKNNNGKITYKIILYLSYVRENTVPLQEKPFHFTMSLIMFEFSADFI